MKIEMTIEELMEIVSDSVTKAIPHILTDSATQIKELDAENERLRRIKELDAENERLRKTMSTTLNVEPAQMTTPVGLLPINSTGMRRLVDELEMALSANDKELAYVADKIAVYFDSCVFNKDGSIRSMSEIIDEIIEKGHQVYNTTTYWDGLPIESYTNLIMDESTWNTVKLKDNYYINFISSVVDIPYRNNTFEVVNRRNHKGVIIQVRTDISIRSTCFH